MMDHNPRSSHDLAARITKMGSKQTYYTFRCFADRDRVGAAYRAYGYFRWVDDILDEGTGSAAERAAFLERQEALLAGCYRGETWEDLCPEEWMLVDLVRSDVEKDSGLQTYLRDMMAVMRLDVERRGQVISNAQLTEYSRLLATAVTEALYYFIDKEDPGPCHEARYLSVTAAHITHMLRDAVEDAAVGYYNIPREVLDAGGIAPQDVDSPAYRAWVTERVQQARRYFELGQYCFAQVRSLRCRLAGYAYTARFEWVLRAIERDDYRLRASYPERKSFSASVWMVWYVLSALWPFLRAKDRPLALAAQTIQLEDS